MFYEWKDIKGRKREEEEKDRISIFLFFIVFPNESVVIYFMLLYARLSS